MAIESNRQVVLTSRQGVLACFTVICIDWFVKGPGLSQIGLFPLHFEYNLSVSCHEITCYGGCYFACVKCNVKHIKIRVTLLQKGVLKRKMNYGPGSIYYRRFVASQCTLLENSDNTKR